MGLVKSQSVTNAKLSIAALENNKTANFNKTENMNKRIRVKENIAEKALFLCALFSILALALITIYIFIKGTPIIFKIGLPKFIFNSEWNPDPAAGEPSYGILSMILASLLATICSVAAGSIISISTAVFLVEIAPGIFVKILKPAIELLAGIPSVVYGFFGLVVIVPLIREYLNPPGNSLLAVIIILTFMVLPTIINISQTAIKSVPIEYKEGSLALGASHMQTIFKVILPAAKSGILAAVVLGMGRAIGETMAVILVAGNSPLMPKSLLNPVRTLTANIALEMGYAFGDHENALFAAGVILFVFIMIINILFSALVNKAGVKSEK